jgi:hypothetical protein
MKPQTTTTVAKSAPAKSASITLRANGSMMLLLAVRTDNGATTTVTTKAPNEKSVRGMTEHHKTFDAAKARLDVLAKEATSRGWTRGKFETASKPDAFKSMPDAPSAPAAPAVQA